MNISDWLRHARSTLAEAGCPDPEIDARWIAEDTLGMTRTDLIFESDRAVPSDKLPLLESLLQRRASGEPVQYILGSADFMGLRFQVDRSVLIPRQDTETLVEAALIAVRGMDAPEVLDLCAGSGCIGLSIKSLAPDARVTLADISREALEVARRNMRALGVEAALHHGDLFRAVGRRRFDIIVSNPPYIPQDELPGLQREVRFEPRLALDGGPAGMDLVGRIIREAPDHLAAGGLLLMEIDDTQEALVLDACGQSGRYASYEVLKDLAGKVRYLKAIC